MMNTATDEFTFDSPTDDSPRNSSDIVECSVRHFALFHTNHHAYTLTTGLPGLDKVLRGIMPGDNIVWQVDNVADYKALVIPYAKAALQRNRRLIYFRFASHEQLIPDDMGAEIHHPDPSFGFESFVTQVHRVIEEAGKHAIYIFDCLSDLASIWRADQMLGNFFLLTCPRLYDLETVTYFCIYRHYHASFALNPITETTQFLLDIFRHEGQLCVRPIKVQHRSTSSMNTMHLWDGDEFRPITSSIVISEMLATSRWPGLRADSRVGFWRRIFNEAQQTYDDARAGRCPPEKEREVFERLSRMILSRDADMLRLVHRYLTLADILEIRDRMIGIGLIGGKALGMLLARAILKCRNPSLHGLLETHDSFYIGSDVFYTFLVRNGVWWLRQTQRDHATFLEGLEEARQKMSEGTFPDYTMDQFMAMLDYFGESPYIVRSSSLLEDTYGNAFAGKYESVFCVNQGSREQRLQALLDTVRKVYASAMSEEALRYRVNRGLLGRDEQMALLVMRVSGARYGEKFFPQIAGVGFSFNPYVWHKDIDPHAGVLRLVFGLGTRAVDRTDDDYTRLVALNAPTRRPEGNFDEVCEYSQHRVDYLDLAANRLVSGYFTDLVKEGIDMPLDMVVSRDSSSADPQRGAELRLDLRRAALEHALRRRHAKPAENAGGSLSESGRYRIRGEFPLRRPLQDQPAAMPAASGAGHENGQTAGGRGSRCRPNPGIARRDHRPEPHDADRSLHLRRSVGLRRTSLAAALRNRPPSRTHQPDASAAAGKRSCCWGRAAGAPPAPILGVPVQFAEINHISVLCEIVTMRENLIPDVSLGTHFLNELVEMNTLYMALFPRQQRNYLNERILPRRAEPAARPRARRKPLDRRGSRHRRERRVASRPL